MCQERKGSTERLTINLSEPRSLQSCCEQHAGEQDKHSEAKTFKMSQKTGQHYY